MNKELVKKGKQPCPLHVDTARGPSRHPQPHARVSTFRGHKQTVDQVNRAAQGSRYDGFQSKLASHDCSEAIRGVDGSREQAEEDGGKEGG